MSALRATGPRTCGSLTVVGDALLDRDLNGTVERLSPEGPVPVVDEREQVPRPGGAGLAAALAAADGRPVTLVTALGDDETGAELARVLAEAGVRVVDIGLGGRTPEKMRVRAGARTLLRVDRSGGSVRIGELTPAAAAALDSPAAVLASDYGLGVLAERSVRSKLASLPASVPLVWDPHRLGAPPVSGTTLVTPNRREAAALESEPEAQDLATVTRQARALAERWGAANVCVTLGADGALLVGGPAPPLAVPAPAIPGGDPCGAGDRFASYVAGLLADGALVREAVPAAVGPSTAFVAAGGAGVVRPGGGSGVNGGADGTRSMPEPRAAEDGGIGRARSLASSVRAAGGTVVAAGGCFDILHAGHVSMLRGARALGDCLIVCLNSDDSVRRLKGDGRPVVAQQDRVAVLEALDCVDAVAVFDEDTPELLLERLRPDLFAKGGDYSLPDIPEARVLERWGGQAVVLPYVPGRSTSGLIEEVVELAR